MLSAWSKSNVNQVWICQINHSKHECSCNSDDYVSMLTVAQTMGRTSKRKNVRAPIIVPWPPGGVWDYIHSVLNCDGIILSNMWRFHLDDNLWLEHQLDLLQQDVMRRQSTFISNMLSRLCLLLRYEWSVRWVLGWLRTSNGTPITYPSIFHIVYGICEE